jgi:glycosyltransferase involved in cell wall biosynthesis
VKILWLKTELLHPVDKGGKIRTYQMLKELKREHEITYLTLDDGTASEDALELAFEYCRRLVRIPHRTKEKMTAGFYAELALNLLSPLPYFIQKYKSPVMKSEIAKLVEKENFDVLVCDFLNPRVNIPEDVPCATVLFQHNVEAMIWRRHYEVASTSAKKAYMLGQWKKAVAYERDACRRFDWVVTVSREDCETIRREYGVENVSDVPTGVDTDFFHPNGEVENDSHNLVFTGSMDWLPNEDAIQFFTKDVLPIVKSEAPDVTLTVVGRKPFQSLIELSKNDSSIIVTGRVEDVRPYMERAAVYIVPIRIGGGTRLKIYEAMAMEKAVVSTSIGAEGLPVENGTEILLADGPEEFADAVIHLLKDENFARRLGLNAAKTVREKYGWSNVAKVFAEACERAIRERGRKIKKTIKR